MAFLKNIHWSGSIVVVLLLLIVTSCNELDPGDWSLVGIEDTEISNREDFITFSVQLSDTSKFDVTVDFSTFDQSAKAGEDYVETTGTITFEAGQTEQFINVELLGSSFNAPQRRFRMRLDNPMGAELHNRNRQATGIISNNKENGISLDISDAEATVGDDEMRFSVILSEATENKVSVEFATKDQSAKAGEDYNETRGMLIFEVGQTEQFIDVELFGATFRSPERKFRLELDNAVGATIEKNYRQAVGTILNSETNQVNLLISDAEAVLGDETIRFPVTLSDPAEGEIKVDFEIFGQSAKAGKDYVDAIGTLTFEEGEIEKIITVDLLGADFSSPKRKFRLKLDNSVGAKLKNSNRQATGTIIKK